MDRQNLQSFDLPGLDPPTPEEELTGEEIMEMNVDLKEMGRQMMLIAPDFSSQELPQQKPG